MALFALGRAAFHFYVTTFTIVVENFLCLGRSFAVMATVAVAELPLVVAGGAVRVAFLVESVVECNIAHAGFQGDFGGTLVVCNNRHGSNSN